MKHKSLVSTTLPIALILGSTTAFATTAIDSFKVAVVKDALASEALIAGDYKHSINTLTAKANIKQFDSLTSLCVAHIKTYKLEAAEDSCSKAIDAIEAKPSRGRNAKLLRAIAYSNRGIARYLNHDNFNAYQDFIEAKSLSDDTVISNNLGYFKKVFNRLAPSETERLTAD